MIKKTLNAWMSKYDALSQRERGLVAAALLAGIVMIGNAVFIDLPLASAQSIEKKLQTEKIELNMLQGKMLTLQRDMRDPDADRRRHLDDLSKQLSEVRGSLAEYERLLVSPSEISALLEKLLSRHAALRLVSLNTLTPLALAQEESVDRGSSGVAGGGLHNKAELKQPGKDSAQIWKHGVEIRLKGSYADLQAYVTELEKSQQRLLWGEVQLKADYPQSEISLKIFTYSLDRVWLKL